MMIVFLFIYICFFFVAITGILRGNTDKLFSFIIFSLPLYFTALSVANLYGFDNIVPVLQGFKEIIIIITLCTLLYTRSKPIKFHLLDWLMVAYFSYCLLYTVLPLGGVSFTDRLLALKSLSFFPFVYFTGRLMDVRKINFTRYFSLLCIVSILAGVVLVIEILRYEHLQLYTGYVEFNRKFFGQEPGGNYGLSWTFETSNGLKRFASFYGGPLELGVNSICTMAVIIALSTRKNNRFLPNRLTWLTLGFTIFAIFMALSRASFVSYFLIIYVYAFITGNRKLIVFFHYMAITAVVVALLWLQGDAYEWVTSTIQLNDSSSLFHILQWLDGIQAISSHPLGMGLGMSGTVANATDSNIGGENQLIILGVQTGLVSVALYVLIYVKSIALAARVFKNGGVKARKPALAVLLIRIGIIIPALTANTESYIYLSYFSWLLTGIIVNIAMEHATTRQPSINPVPA